MLTFALGVSALTGILFGIVPALQASKLNVTSALKEGGRSGEGHRKTSARSLLLIGEVALSLMLLVGAGLLIKSFLRLQEVGRASTRTMSSSPTWRCRVRNIRTSSSWSFSVS